VNRKEHAVATDTQFDDLQSEMEAGVRTMKWISGRAGEIRGELLARHLEQASLVGQLVRRLDQMRKSVAQQCETLRLLREEIQSERKARHSR
jgi:hypothetical protein